jgi:hypothetical protein
VMKECFPREGLPNVFHKLENGEEVTVAYTDNIRSASKSTPRVQIKREYLRLANSSEV